MNYEKAYNEALERARKSLRAAGDVGTDIVTFIFPELRESEDERICKWLVDYFAEIGENWIHREFTCKQIVAYLEKQKINTEGDFGRGYNCGYEACLNSHGAEWFEKQKHPSGCFTCDEYKKGYEEGRRNGFTAGYNKAMKEVEQKEQKPWKVGANAYFTPEQKPVEWSEEDEEIFNNIIEKAKGGHWIEVNEITWLINRFKSLRSRPKSSDNWKPSEEQMKALQNAVVLAAGNKVLARLYEDLKKL